MRVCCPPHTAHALLAAQVHTAGRGIAAQREEQGPL